MASEFDNPTGGAIQELRALASRLQDIADSIVNSAARRAELDIRAAARVVTDHATWHFHIRAIARTCADESAQAHLLQLLGDVK